MAETSNSSLAKVLDIKCYRGDTFKRDLEFFDDEEMTNPIDISDDTFKLNVIKGFDKKSTPILSFTMADGISIIGANTLRLAKTPEDMQLKAGEYTYDLQQTKQDQTVITLLKGAFIIEDDATI